MANDLPDKDKKNSMPVQDAAALQQSPAIGAAGDAIGAYGQNHSLASGSYQKEWDKAGKRPVPWVDDRKRRMAIRVFSRGILGAAFFTIGGHYARRDWGFKGYMDNDNPKNWQITKPLHVLAKIIDSTAGNLVWHGVKTAGRVSGRSIEAAEKLAERAIHFRPTAGNFSPWTGVGRTLGEETVGVTFDFFCASVGDAWGRDIAGWFDPAVKKDWLVKDEQGRSHVKFPEAIKSALKSVTRYVTYNGGEDWFVAVPYTYFMKGQRSLINKFSPGFRYDFDRALNGGSFKVDKQGKIVGNFNKEGIIDLQSRFTTYNIGTLMFRELYDHLAHLVKGKNDHLYGAVDAPPDRGFLGKVGEIGKWMARSAVKGVICMTPAVPFFWITRTPQTKYKGALIHPDGKASSLLAYAHDGREDSVRIGETERHNGTKFSSATPVFFNAYRTDLQTWENLGPAANPFAGQKEINAYGHSFGMADRGLNAIGKAGNTLRKQLHHVPRCLGFEMTNGNFQTYKQLSDRFWNASTAYTPYMIAKAETALLWDSGRMDMAAERMIDGAANLNWGEFKAGAGEIWRSILHKPLDDSRREAEGQWRDSLDRAKPDIFNKTAAEMEMEVQKNRALTKRWQDFIISGRPDDKPCPGDGASLEDTYKIARRGAYADEAARPAATHSEQEEMKKILRDTEPPTKSIH